MINKAYYLIVAGSRSFNDYDFLKSSLDELLINLKEENHPVVIISGTAKGADTLGERYAKENNYDIIRMSANWNKCGKKAGYVRNIEMAQTAKESGFCGCAAFWDGKSPGTKWMIQICEKEQIDCFIYQY